MTGRILVFDSGVGGLSVAREIRALLPAAEMIYVADDAAFPYGNWEDAALADHVVALIGALTGREKPDAVVVACNTASTLVLPPLRARHTLPFVGTVPAIKPAAERTRSKLISVLATPGTVRRDYTRALIAEFASDCHVEVVGSAALAPLAEAHMRGESVSDAAVFQEIAPAFVEQDGRRTDMVVLGCTHFPFLRPQFERVAPWPVEWIDPAPAIARRLVTVMEGLNPPPGEPTGVARLTSGRPWPPALVPFLRSLGLASD
ncbi:MAG: glutamate racemase [Bauldia sp.]|nr:glutamate racemase [Bauldia sp.]